MLARQVSYHLSHSDRWDLDKNFIIKDCSKHLTECCHIKTVTCTDEYNKKGTKRNYDISSQVL
jgi:hypothetical protein